MTRKRATSGFIYIWRDKKKKMYYLGSHWGSENDGYICSSERMKKSYRKRPTDFKRRIYKRINTNRGDLLQEEHRLLQMLTPEKIKTKYYNLETTVYFGPGHEPWNIGKTGLESHRYGKPRPDIAAIMLTERNPNADGSSMRGKRHTEETKRKQADSNRGQKRSETTKAKLKEHHTGRRWYTNGLVDIKAKECPEGFTIGRSQKKLMSAEAQARATAARVGLVWWNNGVRATKSKISPGDGWVRGKKILA